MRRERGSGLGLDTLGESGGDGQRKRGSRGEYGAHEECCEDVYEGEHGALGLLEVIWNAVVERGKFLGKAMIQILGLLSIAGVVYLY